MYLVNYFIFISIYSTCIIYALIEKITDMESKCPATEHKDLKQVQGGYFLHFQLLSTIHHKKENRCTFMQVLKNYHDFIQQWNV